MELLNEWVNPPILTRAQVTKSLGAWSVNKFLDPEDNVHFAEEDLCSIEKGHVYLFKETADGYMQVYMPVKIMDEETGALLSGLRSFRSVEPFVLQDTSYYRYLKDKNKVLRNKKCCLQHFRLTQKDFSKFSKRVSALEAILSKDEVDATNLVEGIHLLVEEADILRESIMGLGGSDPQDEENLTEQIAVLSEFGELKQEILMTKKRLTKRFDRLCSETNAQSKRVRVELALETLEKALQPLRATDLGRVQRELVHRYKVNSGRESSDSIPAHLKSLKEEIGVLSQYYPALRHVSVDNDTVNVTVGQVTIVLSPQKVWVKGNIADLAPYTDGMSVTEEVGKRRRRIITPAKSTTGGDNL